MAVRIVTACCWILILAVPGSALADLPPNCRQAEQRYEDFRRRAEARGPVKESTEAALAELTTEWLETRIDDPVAARDEILDRDPPVRTKDQRLIVRRMVVVYCEIIFLTEGLGEDAKLDLFNRVTAEVSRAQPFDPVETTREERQARVAWQPAPMDDLADITKHASLSISNEQYIVHNRSTKGRESAILTPAIWLEEEPSEHFVLLASAQPKETNPTSGPASDEPPTADDRFDEPESEFLAEAPYVVNDTNKYFVILGSAASRTSGVRMMNRFKMSSPEYDFALYPPYRGNPHYAVMIATWVSRDVAVKAQAAGLEVVQNLLKEDFVAARDTPYIWCFPTGSCRSGAQ